MHDDEAVLGPDDLDAVSQLAFELIDTWRAQDRLDVTRRKFDAQKIGAVYGLAAHVHSVAPIALDLLLRGLVLEAMPLVRTVFECAITAQWVAQVPEAPAAFANEDVRQRLAMIKTWERALPGRLADRPELIDKLNADVIELESSVSARRFDQLCADLEPGGNEAYAHYRFMSSMSHASVTVVDRYLDEADEPPGFAIRTTPKQPDQSPWAFFMAACLVWAGRAVDFSDKDHRRRSQLRTAARRLAITPELQPSQAARDRRSGRQT
jgi:hypothetical protein